MPPNATAPKPTPKNAPKKIPTWGWIIGAILGILIGYFVLRGSPANAANSALSPSDTGGGNASSDPTTTPTGQIPWEDIIRALGLRSGTGTTPATTTTESGAQTAATAAASDPGPQARPSPETVLAAAGYIPNNPVDVDPSDVLTQAGFIPNAPVATDPASVLTTAGIARGNNVGYVPPTQTVNIDDSGHVVSPKGTRVGGVAEPV